MSKNSWLVGTTGMSFHWVFILAALEKEYHGVVRVEAEIGGRQLG